MLFFKFLKFSFLFTKNKLWQETLLSFLQSKKTKKEFRMSTSVTVYKNGGFVHIDAGRALSDIPVKNRTLECCLNAVQSNGYNIAHVPGNLKTDEICLIAVRLEGNEAFKHVPWQKQTVSLYKEALGIEKSYGQLGLGWGKVHNVRNPITKMYAVIRGFFDAITGN